MHVPRRWQDCPNAKREGAIRNQDAIRSFFSHESAEEACVYLAAVKPGSDRAFPRSRVLMTGMLMTPEGAVSVRIRDISVTGAQVWAQSGVPSNCDAILKRGSFFVAARVKRSVDRYVALQFYRQLSDQEFSSALAQRSLPPTAQRVA